LLQRLTDAPVMGVSLGNVSLLRLDQIDGPAPGNKSFKLQEYLAAARRLGVRRLVSFGGAWSNHLHALAAVGHQQNFETVGIVRAEADGEQTAMLADARRWGMRIVHVSRSEYRMRADAQYQQAIAAKYGPCQLIPEGGAGVEGARGCMAIAETIKHNAAGIKRIALAVGTGTTLAGITANLDAGYEVLGISALKGALDLEQRVDDVIRGIDAADNARWRVEHDYHCGGFARTHVRLREFILDFESVHGIALEPVYTGKMLYAIAEQQRSGAWAEELPLIAIHSGGLQGRRGYPWLASRL
jgi:1-aminocyclopropane-1-carboxylate deaminase